MDRWGTGVSRAPCRAVLGARPQRFSSANGARWPGPCGRLVHGPGTYYAAAWVGIRRSSAPSIGTARTRGPIPARTGRPRSERSCPRLRSRISSTGLCYAACPSCYRAADVCTPRRTPPTTTRPTPRRPTPPPRRGSSPPGCPPRPTPRSWLRRCSLHPRLSRRRGPSSCPRGR